MKKLGFGLMRLPTAENGEIDVERDSFTLADKLHAA